MILCGINPLCIMVLCSITLCGLYLWPLLTLYVLYCAVLTLYVRKEEELIYNALLLDSLTVYDFKFQVRVDSLSSGMGEDI